MLNRPTWSFPFAMLPSECRSDPGVWFFKIKTFWPHTAPGAWAEKRAARSWMGIILYLNLYQAAWIMALKMNLNSIIWMERPLWREFYPSLVRQDFRPVRTTDRAQMHRSPVPVVCGCSGARCSRDDTRRCQTKTWKNIRSQNEQNGFREPGPRRRFLVARWDTRLVLPPPPTSRNTRKDLTILTPV